VWERACSSKGAAIRESLQASRRAALGGAAGAAALALMPALTWAEGELAVVEEVVMPAAPMLDLTMTEPMLAYNFQYPVRRAPLSQRSTLISQRVAYGQHLQRADHLPASCLRCLRIMWPAVSASRVFATRSNAHAAADRGCRTVCVCMRGWGGGATTFTERG
jgi:hypothetical protein